MRCEQTETGKKIVKEIEPKTTYTHATAGDVVKVTLKKDRKHVKAGVYRSRVKTPTPKGVEVLVDGKRISVETQFVKFIHRSDGYAYRFAPILSDLFQDIATS